MLRQSEAASLHYSALLGASAKLTTTNSPAWSRKGNSGFECGIICNSQTSGTESGAANSALRLPLALGARCRQRWALPAPRHWLDLLIKRKEISDFNKARPVTCHRGQGTHLCHAAPPLLLTPCLLRLFRLTLENAHQKHHSSDLHARPCTSLLSFFLQNSRAVSLEWPCRLFSFTHNNLI